MISIHFLTSLHGVKISHSTWYPYNRYTVKHTPNPVVKTVTTSFPPESSNFYILDKGVVINYREGGYNMGKSRSGVFAHHPPSRQGKTFLAEFQNLLKLTHSFFLNFLYDIRGILPEININSPCSFPTGDPQTWWDLTIGFYGRHLTFISN